MVISHNSRLCQEYCEIEAMAQACGLIMALGFDFDVKNEIAFLAGVDDAKFKRVVIPGDQLILEAEITHKRKSLIKASASASVDGQLASCATITLVIKPI